MNDTIEPRILKGTRDFLPEQMAKRMFVMNSIRSVFERMGYDTIETPVIEYQETLLGKYGDEGSQLTYKFEDNGGRKIALRYDQTVPTARFVAQYTNDLPMPFKRYQISRVWRADKPAKGRYREFYQCDIDVIGTDSVLADAEVANCIYQVFNELKFNDFVIRVNSRKLINQVLEQANIATENQTRVIQLIDKLDKVSAEVVRAELVEVISEAAADAVMNLVTLTGTNAEKLTQLKEYNITELEQLLSFAKQFGIPEENIVFDPSLARGLDYYTGLIFETIIPSLQLGSVCGGGRYADLCGMFGKKDLSGVGVAFGFDRILVAMEELGMLSDIGLNSQVLVTNFSEETLPYAISLLTDLQAAGVNSEIYFEPTKLVKQFKYANKKQIPFVVMCGEDEVRDNVVTIKIMESGKQKVIPRDQLTSYFLGLSE